MSLLLRVFGRAVETGTRMPVLAGVGGGGAGSWAETWGGRERTGRGGANPYRRVAEAVVAGRTREAVELVEDGPITAPDLLLRAAVCGHAGEYRRASRMFGHAVEELLTPAEAAAGDRGLDADRLEQVLAAARREFGRGAFAEAAERFAAAAELVDALLAAHGGWAAAELQRGRPGAGELAEQLLAALVGLAQLSDSLLRHEVRTRLATHLAEQLQRRGLPAARAGRAVGGPMVAACVRAEAERVQGELVTEPGRADLHFRVALLLRAGQDLAGAAGAFRRVLAILPHHTAAAVRLAATLAEMGRAPEAAGVLEQGERISREELGRYYAVARARQDAAGFERALAAVGPAGRANLVALLDVMGVEGLADAGGF